MSLVSLLAALAGLIFLIRGIVGPIFGKDRKIKAAVIDLVLFVICVAGAIIIYRVGNPVIPLTPDERQRFKNAVWSYAGLMRVEPLSQAARSRPALEALLQQVGNKRRYEKEMPDETALLHRLYAASLLLSARDRSRSLGSHVEMAFPHIAKSMKISAEVWNTPHERAAYDFFKKFYRKEIEEVLFEEFAVALYTVAMTKATEAEVRTKAKVFEGLVIQLAGTPKTDMEYFEAFPGKDPNYGTYIQTLRIMVEGQGGTFDGPLPVPMSDGRTKVMCIIHPKGKAPVTLEWIVSKDRNTVEPQTDLAEELHSVVVKGKAFQ